MIDGVMLEGIAGWLSCCSGRRMDTATEPQWGRKRRKPCEAHSGITVVVVTTLEYISFTVSLLRETSSPGKIGSCIVVEAGGCYVMALNTLASANAPSCLTAPFLPASTIQRLISRHPRT
jgi:hypothetical protein